MLPLDFILDFGGAISEFSQQHSEWILPLFFLLVFCETGLVLTPFLPGSTLLFIAGGLAALGDFALYEIQGLLAVAGVAVGMFAALRCSIERTIAPPIERLWAAARWRILQICNRS